MKNDNTFIDEYIKLLVHSKSSISKDTQIDMITYLFDIFVQYNKDLLLVDGGQISQIRSRKAFETLANMRLQVNYPDIKIKSYDEEKKTYRWNIRIGDIYDTITSVNCYSLMRYESNLFAEKQEVFKNPLTSKITVVMNTLHIKAPDIIEGDEYTEIVDDYKNHFPQFQELLKLIMDMRFAKDRKASFVHLRVASNWGKSFLSGLFKNLEVGFEVDYHNLMNKGASDIAPIQVRNSFVMFLDEFNNFSAEMKKLSHSFSFAPKFGMREEVELYLKVLMSAEQSPSFSGGVDEQIVNRVMVIDIPDSDVVKLTEREVYKRHGNARYMRALEMFAYLELSEHLFQYLAMEQFEAHRIADVEVNKALEKYRMKDVSNLNDTTRDVINSTIEEIIDSDDISLNPKYREMRGNIILIGSGKYKGKIFIKAPLRTFEIILKNSVSEAEYKKMRYKLFNVEDIVSIVADYRKKKFRLHGKLARGLVIDIAEPKDHKQIIQDLIKEGNLIVE